MDGCPVQLGFADRSCFILNPDTATCGILITARKSREWIVSPNMRMLGNQKRVFWVTIKCNCSSENPSLPLKRKKQEGVEI